MKAIYWKKLTGFEKFLFVLGWFSAGNALFWIIMLITYVTRDESKKLYNNFFSPHTFKVPYIFGWVSFFILLITIVLFILLSFIGLTFNV